MASIQRIEGKKGVSYKITVTLGEDARGKKIRHFKTWKPDRPMNIKKMEKEVQRVAFEFEKEIEMGFQADNRQTFEEYAWYVIRLKERQGAAKSTIVNYEYEMERIAAAIGHMKLRDIRPQHLNAFYQELEKPGIMKYKSMAAPKADIKALLKKQNLTQRELARLSGVSHTTAEEASNGRAIRADKAEKIAKVLGRKTEDLFDIDHRDGALSSSTIVTYLIIEPLRVSRFHGVGVQGAGQAVHRRFRIGEAAPGRFDGHRHQAYGALRIRTCGNCGVQRFIQPCRALPGVVGELQNLPGQVRQRFYRGVGDGAHLGQAGFILRPRLDCGGGHPGQGGTDPGDGGGRGLGRACGDAAEVLQPRLRAVHLRF